ncbi:putative nucleic acid-binding protein [Lupinus albus]|uniref:Putative nucleic acid-binding protein n=1 Tax=Lupinus albus TaxID=3870 RepID=A0A6A4NGS2_LUPAL|nr:putative nucleic acid-binding protein [Lupinus albus]
MSISRPFELIRDLNDSKYLWKIAVRITYIWYVQLPPKPGHMKMILMDCKGDKIQVYVKKDDFNEWRKHFIENKTYVMQNFNVLHNDIQFKACSHAYRMQFNAGITIKDRDFPIFHYLMTSILTFWLFVIEILLMLHLLLALLMSISHPFELIRDLNDSKYMWKIVVRIIYIWYVQLLLKPGHMEMILMDCKGDKIQVSVKKDDFNE